MIGTKAQPPERREPSDYGRGRTEDLTPDNRGRTEDLTTADMAAAGRGNQWDGPNGPDFSRQPGDTASAMMTAPTPVEEDNALLDRGEAEDFRRRWERIQTGFVDEPRRSVEEADKLVAATMSRLAEVFAKERENLEREWAKGEDVSTEDLRIALRRYRSFFDRLLSV